MILIFFALDNATHNIPSRSTLNPPGLSSSQLSTHLRKFPLWSRMCRQSLLQSATMIWLRESVTMLLGLKGAFRFAAVPLYLNLTNPDLVTATTLSAVRSETQYLHCCFLSGIEGTCNYPPRKSVFHFHLSQFLELSLVLHIWGFYSSCHYAHWQGYPQNLCSITPMGPSLWGGDDGFYLSLSNDLHGPTGILNVYHFFLSRHWYIIRPHVICSGDCFLHGLACVSAFNELVVTNDPSLTESDTDHSS